MDRQELSDTAWSCIADEVPGKVCDPTRTGRDNRQFVEAILWFARSGAHWRVLLREFGKVLVLGAIICDAQCRENRSGGHQVQQSTFHDNSLYRNVMRRFSPPTPTRLSLAVCWYSRRLRG